MKKILTSLVILTLLFSSFSTVVFADTAAFTVTYSDGTASTTADSLSAVATLVNAKNDDSTVVTVTLTKDVTESTIAEFSNKTKVVVDLNGNTITFPSGIGKKFGFTIGGEATIKNGSIIYNGTENYAIKIFGNSASQLKKLTIENVKLTSATGGITTGWSGTLSSQKGAEVTITGENTEITASTVVFYSMKTNGTYNIYDGKFTSTNANSSIYKWQAGNVNIYGGTFENTTSNPDDAYAMGQGYTSKSNTKFDITGGTFPCDVSEYLDAQYYSNKIGANKFEVSNASAAYTDDTISNRYYNSATSYLTNDTTYKTLAYAIEDAGENDIYLLANNAEGAVANRPLTIIKNGFSANVTAGEGYVLKETDDAYIIEEAPEEITVDENITASYDDGKGTKTTRFFAVIFLVSPSYSTDAPSTSNIPRSGTRTRPSLLKGIWSKVTYIPLMQILISLSCVETVLSFAKATAVNNDKIIETISIIETTLFFILNSPFNPI